MVFRNTIEGSFHHSAIQRLLYFSSHSMKVFVIIPAAGLGTRMAASQPGGPGQLKSKQFYEIAGMPILVHTLRRFAGVPQVDAIVVALRAGEIAPFQVRLNKEPYAAKVELVEGGEHRQRSEERRVGKEC